MSRHSQRAWRRRSPTDRRGQRDGDDFLERRLLGCRADGDVDGATGKAGKARPGGTLARGGLVRRGVDRVHRDKLESFMAGVAGLSALEVQHEPLRRPRPRTRRQTSVEPDQQARLKLRHRRPSALVAVLQRRKLCRCKGRRETLGTQTVAARTPSLGRVARVQFRADRCRRSASGQGGVRTARQPPAAGQCESKDPRSSNRESSQGIPPYHPARWLASDASIGVKSGPFQSGTK